jgi:tetratricopeptide (TPR) repeat protein
LNASLCYFKLQKWQLAANKAAAALRTDPKSAKALFRRANAREEMAEFSDAKKDFLAAAKIEPQNAELRKCLRRVQDKLDAPQDKTTVPKGFMLDSAGIKRMYVDKELSAEQKQDLQAHNAKFDDGFEQAESWLAQRNLAAALGEFEKLALFVKGTDEHKTSTGQRAALFSTMGNICTALDKHDDAILHHEQCLQIAESTGDMHQQASCHGNLGRALQASQQLEPALVQHRAALRLALQGEDYAASGRAHGGLGLVLLQLGHHKEAVLELNFAYRQAQVRTLQNAKRHSFHYSALSRSLATKQDYKWRLPTSVRHCTKRVMPMKHRFYTAIGSFWPAKMGTSTPNPGAGGPSLPSSTRTNLNQKKRRAPLLLRHLYGQPQLRRWLGQLPPLPRHPQR